MEDLVLLKNKRVEQRKGGKLEADMLGPFKIMKIEGKCACLLSKRKRTMANTDNLVHYIQPEERIPAKLRKALDSSFLAGPSQTAAETMTDRTSTGSKTSQLSTCAETCE